MRNRKKGFTLIELIVVIAILAIIAAIAVPSFGKLKEASAERVCFANQETLRRSYLAELAADGGASFDLDAFMTEQGLTKSGSGYTGFCPTDGGVYMVRADITAQQIVILCSIHDSEDVKKVYESTGNVQDAVGKLLGDISGMTAAEIKAYAEALGMSGFYGSNDQYRKLIETYMMQNGTWPAITEDFKVKYGLSGNLNIQPYIAVKNGTPVSDEESIIFANGSSSGNWYTSLIYDKDEGVWYYNRKGYSVANKTWSEVKDTIHSTSSPWTALD